MLLYPDFFKVGVSESGNHDFRTYGWYWGEKYQGRLNTAGEATAYEAQANYQYARNLKGKLLLIHGDMDCNNPPAETLRLVDALIKEQKDFDMLIVPDAGHQLPSYAMKRAWDYFTRYLNGEEPPTDYKLR
jgi:dipeptidyl aminopeptidase/acylaminoacyl peptidase